MVTFSSERSWLVSCLERLRECFLRQMMLETTTARHREATTILRMVSILSVDWLCSMFLISPVSRL